MTSFRQISLENDVIYVKKFHSNGTVKIIDNPHVIAKVAGDSIFWTVIFSRWVWQYFYVTMAYGSLALWIKVR